MKWQIEYIKILLKKFNLLRNITNNCFHCNYDMDIIINELNNIKEIKQFILKIYVVKKIIKSMTFHLVAKTDNYIELNILNNNSKNKKIDIDFKYIDMEEYDSIEYKTTKPSTFGYNIWKHSVKENLLEYFSNQIKWSEDTHELYDLLQNNNYINCEIFNNKTINYISVLYNNSYKLYDYDEIEYLISLENDNMIYHLYYIVDDCSAEECYTNIQIKEYNSIEEFVKTIPECLFMKYYKNNASLQYNDCKYMVEMDYIYELLHINN